MAPVSRLSRPKCRARCRAMVLFPAPAGPSIATMILRPGSTERRGFLPRSSALLRALFGRGGKAKPLAFPALAPAARAGLRLLRADRASARASFLGGAATAREAAAARGLPALPPFAAIAALCHCRAQGLLLRAVEGTLASRCRCMPLPLGRAPFRCAPLFRRRLSRWYSWCRCAASAGGIRRSSACRGGTRPVPVRAPAAALPSCGCQSRHGEPGGCWKSFGPVCGRGSERPDG